MKRKFNQRKIMIILIVIFSIILISMYKIAQEKNLRIQDDLIFLKLLGNQKQNPEQSQTLNQNLNSKTSNKKTVQYEIKVSNKNPSYTEINLWQTIDYKTLVNKKVAPGTKGNFEIILTSDSTLKYKIKLIGKNQKPANLKFYIEQGKEGEIKKGEIKKIGVCWEWKYETSLAQNRQDTKDGEEIKQYNFEICTIGE